MWYRFTLVNGPVAEPIEVLEINRQNLVAVQARADEVWRLLYGEDIGTLRQVRRPDGTWADLTSIDR